MIERLKFEGNIRRRTVICKFCNAADGFVVSGRINTVYSCKRCGEENYKIVNGEVID